MPLASEIVTWQETPITTTSDSAPIIRMGSRIRSNSSERRLRAKLEQLGLWDRVETLVPIIRHPFWSGSGNGYEIHWRITTTWDDLQPLARL